MPINSAPGLISASSSGPPSAAVSGRWTLSTMSAPASAVAASGTIVAPAAASASSVKDAPSPAPASTASSGPRATSFFTVSGDAATRASRARPSVMTPSFMAEDREQRTEDRGRRRDARGIPSFAVLCPLFSVLWLIGEGVADQDGVVALRAGREQGDRGLDQLLDAADVLDRGGRQLRPGASAAGRLRPALQGLIDRPGGGLTGHRPPQGAGGFAVRLAPTPRPCA